MYIRSVVCPQQLVPLCTMAWRLRDLDVTGNPVTAMPKFRDHITLASESIGV